MAILLSKASLKKHVKGQAGILCRKKVKSVIEAKDDEWTRQRLTTGD